MNPITDSKTLQQTANDHRCSKQIGQASAPFVESWCSKECHPPSESQNQLAGCRQALIVQDFVHPKEPVNSCFTPTSSRGLSCENQIYRQTIHPRGLEEERQILFALLNMGHYNYVVKLSTIVSSLMIDVKNRLKEFTCFPISTKRLESGCTVSISDLVPIKCHNPARHHWNRRKLLFNQVVLRVKLPALLRPEEMTRQYTWDMQPLRR